MVKLSPKSEALAFRIWAYCRDVEWRISVSEVAEALGEHPSRVTLLAQRKGWLGRFSTVRQDHRIFGDRVMTPHSVDAALDGGSYVHALRELKLAAGIKPGAAE